MTEAYIGLGANLGDRLDHLKQAVRMLEATPKTRVLRQSLVYETEPVGGVPQGDYLNQVVVVATTLSAPALLARLHEIEQALHRTRIVRWGARSVDLDLLYFGAQTSDTPELTLPHPQIANRRFVLVPLLEVAGPGKIDSVKQLLQATTDTAWVRPYRA